jgi:protein-S-isoprenylcysteine O-methyltransferase Ste14
MKTSNENKGFRQVFSLILPVTVLIIVPGWLEYGCPIAMHWYLPIGLILMCLGFILTGITISIFHKKGNGTLAPWDPPVNLITTGPYAYVRNPMIMGVITVLFGEVLTLSSLKILIWILIFIVMNNVHFRLYEEPSLQKKFGNQYTNYKKQVHRWNPRKKPYR